MGDSLLLALLFLGCAPDADIGGLEGAASARCASCTVEADGTITVDLLPLSWVDVEGLGATGPLAAGGESGVEWRAELPMLQPGDLVLSVSGAVDDPVRNVLLSLHRDPRAASGQGSTSMAWGLNVVGSQWSIEVDTSPYRDLDGDGLDDSIDPYEVVDGVGYEFAVWLGYSAGAEPVEITELSLSLEPGGP